jgi:hypothetical protein
MTNEWDRFRFEIGKGYSSKLTIVRHVAHVQSARRIVEDGQIRALLVRDKSRLNTSRVSVAWVSANKWVGSIYGTVEFQFAWDDILNGREVYWVEAMMNYNPNAYRFLLCRPNAQVPWHLVTRYNPAKDDGPLRFSEGKYFWNGEFTSEFMIDDDLSLEQCKGVKFVLHHREWCRPFGDGCDERISQPQPSRTGAIILSFILSRNLHALDALLKPPGLTEVTELDTAYNGLQRRFPAPATFVGPLGRADQCQDVVRGSLAFFAADQADQARQLLHLINSKESAENVLKEIVRAHFGAPTWEPNPDF